MRSALLGAMRFSVRSSVLAVAARPAVDVVAREHDAADGTQTDWAESLTEPLIAKRDFITLYYIQNGCDAPRCRRDAGPSTSAVNLSSKGGKKMTTIKRRSFLTAAALIPLAMTTRPARLYADGLGVVLGQGDALEYIREENAKGTLWVTYELDGSGEPVEVSHTDMLNSLYLDAVEPRSASVSISVIVGNAIAGYVVGVVVDGIIIRVTGQSGAAWVAYAVGKLLNHPVPPNKAVYLSCDIYPPHSMEYIRCSNA